MEEVFQWVKNIVYYLIFSHLILHLMPNGKYEQYMKLFFGAVFILLVTSPLTGRLHLAEKLAYAYEQIRFEQEHGEFEQQLWGMEHARIDQMMLQYEEAVASDAAAIAREEGFFCIDAQAEIERREEEETFGKVVRIALTLCRENEDREVVSPVEERKISAVEEIRIKTETGAETEWENTDRTQTEIRTEAQAGTRREQERICEIQRKVAEYYGLEEHAVQITWKDD